MKRGLSLIVLSALILLAIPFAFAQSCATPLSGTAVWIKGDGNTIDSVTGSSGISTAAPVLFVPSVVGRGMLFRGSSEILYDVTSIGPALQDGFSFDMWFRLSNMAFGEERTIFDLRDDFGHQLAAVNVKRGLIFPDLTGAIFRVSVSGQAILGPPVIIPQGQFVFLYGSFNITDFSFGVNSQKFSVQIPRPNQAPLQPGPPTKLALGKEAIFGFGGYLNGTIDEFELMTDAHDLNDFDPIFAAGSAGKCPIASLSSLSAQVISSSLSSGLQNSLLSKIDAASAAYSSAPVVASNHVTITETVSVQTDNSNTAGNNILGAFINEVDALAKAKKLTSTEADSLTNTANLIIAQHP